MDPLPPDLWIDPAAALVIIINDASGEHDSGETRAAIGAALVAAGRPGELLFTRPEDLARLAQQAAATARARHSAVVAVGGDGTINAVAQAAHAAGCVMGVVPQGTFNYFADRDNSEAEARAQPRSCHVRRSGAASGGLRWPPLLSKSSANGRLLE
jgi:hypothetical protein